MTTPAGSTSLSSRTAWTRDYGYDDANRLTDVTNTGPGPTTISDYHYELDAVGNRTEMTDLSGTHEYVYDALYR